MQTSIRDSARLAKRQRAIMTATAEFENDDMTIVINGLCDALGVVDMNTKLYIILVESLAAARRVAASAHSLLLAGRST